VDVHDARTGGAEGNERLTAATAVMLLLLLAAEGVTIVFLRPLLSEHIFIGMLLIPPVALKTGSTGWRFFRYYSGDRTYRTKGPPMLPLRLLAPLVVASTIAVFATGIALLIHGPRDGFVLGLHKASFIVWGVATAIHVLAYVWRIPALAASDWRRRDPEHLGGSFLRRTLLAGALVAGLVLALATARYAQPWVHWQSAH
jgi:hypothetical protein